MAAVHQQQRSSAGVRQSVAFGEGRHCNGSCWTACQRDHAAVAAAAGICHVVLCADMSAYLLVPCRAREKLMDRRNRLIEEVIKHDPEYKPPADYK